MAESKRSLGWRPQLLAAAEGWLRLLNFELSPCLVLPYAGGRGRMEKDTSKPRAEWGYH